MAQKRRGKRRAKRRGTAGLGALKADIMRCTKYKTRGKVTRCALYAAGKGNPTGRPKSVKGPYRYTTAKGRKARRKGK